MHKKVFIIIGAVLVIIVAFAAWYLMPISKSPSIEDEYKNWQTYRNNEFGFEFQYPKDGILKFNGQVIDNLPKSIEEPLEDNEAIRKFSQGDYSIKFDIYESETDCKSYGYAERSLGDEVSIVEKGKLHTDLGAYMFYVCARSGLAPRYRVEIEIIEADKEGTIFEVISKSFKLI